MCTIKRPKTHMSGGTWLRGVHEITWKNKRNSQTKSSKHEHESCQATSLRSEHTGLLHRNWKTSGGLVHHKANALKTVKRYLTSGGGYLFNERKEEIQANVFFCFDMAHIMCASQFLVVLFGLVYSRIWIEHEFSVKCSPFL